MGLGTGQVVTAADFAWTSYTPTLTNVTLGSATVTAHYATMGKIMIVRGQITLGSGSAITGQVSWSVPVVSTENAAGSLVMVDTGTRYYTGSAALTAGSGSIIFAHSSDATSVISTTSPFTWTNTDVFWFTITYPIA